MEVNIRCISVKGEDGDAYILFLEDLTAANRIIQELESAVSEKERIVVLKSQFVSMISHEMRTPLTSILASAELLERRYLSPDADEKESKHFERLYRNVEQMIKLLEDVLLLGELENNTQSIRSERMAVRDVRTHIEEFAELHHFLDRLDIAEHFWDTEIACDSTMLEVMLTNLLGNAAKYSPDHTRVEVESQLIPNCCIAIVVSDRGIGFPDDIAFEPALFNRGTNVGSVRGTGLGLHIVSRLMTLHGGEVQIYRRGGGGSIVKLMFPITDGTQCS